MVNEKTAPREILFRGKRTDNGEWAYGAFCPDATEMLHGVQGIEGFIRRYNENSDHMDMFEVSRETVGQYTGLTDKNGVKVFEDDIVHVHDVRLQYCDPYHEFDGFIDYADNSFRIIGDDCFMHYRWLDYEVEVIGNIHDNPELLSSKEIRE